MNQEQALELKPGDKLKLVNLTKWDNYRGFYGGDIVTFVKTEYKTVDTHKGPELFLYFEEKKDTCNYGMPKYFELEIGNYES